MELYIGNYYGIGYRKLIWNWIQEIPMELVRENFFKIAVF